MSVVAAQKQGSWSSYKQLWPVPQSDINKDINLSQNSGY
jgi:hypothetical protein